MLRGSRGQIHTSSRASGDTATVSHSFVPRPRPRKNHIDFNDTATFESYFLNPPSFAISGRLQVTWLYRGFRATNRISAPDRPTQCRTSLAPFHLVDGNANPDSDAAVQAQLNEVANINSLINDPLEVFTINSTTSMSRCQIPRSSQCATRLPRPCLEFPPRILYVSLRVYRRAKPGGRRYRSPDHERGHRIRAAPPNRPRRRSHTVHLVTSTGQDEREHLFISELPFRRAILFKVNRTTLPNGDQRLN
jgi:hypothetical protein